MAQFGLEAELIVLGRIWAKLCFVACRDITRVWSILLTRHKRAGALLVISRIIGRAHTDSVRVTNAIALGYGEVGEEIFGEVIRCIELEQRTIVGL